MRRPVGCLVLSTVAPTPSLPSCSGVPDVASGISSLPAGYPMQPSKPRRSRLERHEHRGNETSPVRGCDQHGLKDLPAAHIKGDADPHTCSSPRCHPRSAGMAHTMARARADLAPSASRPATLRGAGPRVRRALPGDCVARAGRARTARVRSRRSDRPRRCRPESGDHGAVDGLLVVAAGALKAALLQDRRAAYN